MNRKRKVRRRLIRDKGAVGRPPSAEAKELRQRRTRRYQKRRAVLKGHSLKSTHSTSGARRPLRSPTQPTTVLGQTQNKQLRRQQRRRKNGRAPMVSAGQRPSMPNGSSKPSLRRRSPDARRLDRRKRRVKQSVQMMRLLVSGVGVALIAGFSIAFLHPESSERHDQLDSVQFQSAPESAAVSEPVSEPVATPPPPSYEIPGKELRQLKQEIRGLVEQEPDLTTGLFFLNPETNEFVTHRGSELFPAASMIKLPILIAFFQDVDDGKIQLNEQLVMRPDLIAGEAGAMQFDEPNSRYDALQVADWMITISDNTATNMLIDRLGGAEELNLRFTDWGLTQTKINQLLPDLEGMNTMTPKDLAVLMAKVSQGELLTPHSRDRALEILRHTVTNTLLPQGIAPNAQIAHKTGDIGMAVGDVGLIDMPNGQRYVGTVVVKRPHNDPRAQDLIRAISKLTYKIFSERPLPRSLPSSSDDISSQESADRPSASPPLPGGRER